MASLAELFVGQMVGGEWHLDGLVGRGQFSSVYRASSGDQVVALKMLHPDATKDPSTVAEFQTEAELLDILRDRQCRNVVNLIEGAATGTIQVQLNSGVEVPIPVQYHLLDLADGSLDELVANHASLDWTLRLNLLRDVAAGLHQMHRCDIAHRDVKSSNVLVTADGKMVARAALSDLGRSARIDQVQRFSTASYVYGRGDCSFAPPELLWGKGIRSGSAFRQADLYLLGSVLCELATGQPTTAMLIPSWQALLHQSANMPPAERDLAHRAHISALRPRLAAVAVLIHDVAPRPIATDLADLFAQLCDPDPAGRGRRTRRERNLSATDFAWLLQRIDRIRKQHAICSRRQLQTLRGASHAHDTR